jgi:hypothetical protein
MNSSIRRTLVLVTGIAALGAASASFAGMTGKALDQFKDGGDDQKQSQPAPAAQPAPQRQSAQPERGARPPQSQGRGQGQVQRDRGAGQQAQSAGQRDRSGFPPNRSGDRGEAVRRDNGSGVNFRNYSPRNVRPPRVVQQLPRGYRNYNWNGRPYYNYGGHWYRPYGSSYISIGVPYGLFVATLPGYSSSFYYGNSRYYYYDDTYYVYEPARRGYVVTRSPYNDDPVESSDEQPVDDDLYIYPAKGQSEQQQSDDRYECHRWAADETHYDPIDDAYQPDDRANYLRAMTACLTGRGYSVK